MDRVLSELKVVFRQLRKASGFTATAVLMLAFGIGATTAIFSIVYGVLLRPLPFPEANCLVTLGDQVSGTDWGQHDPGPVTGPEVVTYARDTHAFSGLGGFGLVTVELSGIGEPAQVIGTRMSPALFPILGVAPLMGRVFTEQEDQRKEPVAVLSYSTWKSRFQGDPHVVGTKVLIDRKPVVIIGVMPRSFEFPLYPGRRFQSELWLPIRLSPQELSPAAAASWYLQMVGRLKPGVTPAQAQSDAAGVAQQIMRNFPPDAANFRIRPVVYPLQEIAVSDARPLLRMLFLAIAVVLLIACANLAGLMLVRAIHQQHETAVRLAIGASTFTLLRTSVLEGLVLSISGGLLGIGLAALALALGKSLLPETLPRLNDITLNWPVVGFALLLAVLTGLVCGLVPGIAAVRTNMNASLKEGGRSGTAGGGHARLRSGLVVMEIAVALVLLTAAGLLLRSFRNMTAVDLGFQPNHVTTATYQLPRKQYATQVQVDTFNQRLLAELRRLPGVTAAGFTSALPTGGDETIESFVVENYVDPRGPDRSLASPSQVSGDYFKAIGIPLIRGRYFNDEDTASTELVMIVNHAFAEHYWPHQDPIGKRVRTGSVKSGTPWMTVVGEVADTKLGSPDAPSAEQFYQPVAQVAKDNGPEASPTDLNGTGAYVVVRSALPPEQMENTLRSVVRSIDMQLPLTQLQTMDQVVAQSEAPRRFNTAIISCFALAAVLLAVLGIYSVIAFSVAARVQEMAIRMALGSQRADIVRLVVASGMKLAAVGCAVGLAGAAAASTLLKSFLFHVSPFDPAVMLLTAVVVFALALAASALPARRAASVNPTTALRGE